ncbi:hypothetical protein [Citreimonas sp.]|uniref:hypothetical protein n=1 Tax=Citreimonas sp. TaxID=3036715 RepID=UPI0035C8404B
MSFRKIRLFRRTEDGAITVDWVVICAAIVALGLFATNLISTNAVTSVNASATRMQEMPAYGQ